MESTSEEICQQMMILVNIVFDVSEVELLQLCVLLFHLDAIEFYCCLSIKKFFV